jgi:hypothetical protein
MKAATDDIAPWAGDSGVHYLIMSQGESLSINIEEHFK